jgi:hypothetical protein
MKMMAYGEYAAFLLGPAAAIRTAMALDGFGFVFRFVWFLLAWYFATSMGLRLVHLGYVPVKAGKA